jgi:hypothetical protein
MFAARLIRFGGRKSSHFDLRGKTMNLTDPKNVALGSTAVLGLSIFLATILLCGFWFPLSSEKLALAKDLFNVAIIQVLLPMFNTLVAAALTYVFGKVIVDSIAARIRGPSSSKS